jgi:NAD(P)-dependent dehydrogenase (short-subunit alcohol dehydrogenase family)
VDVLVNNAGTIARAPAAEHTDEDWDRVLQVDLTSQFVLTREIGHSMIARGRPCSSALSPPASKRLFAREVGAGDTPG